MPGQAIGISMNFGYPGSFARNADCIIGNHTVKTNDSIGPSFGDPVVLNSDNSISKFGASNTVAQFDGVAVREVQQNSSYAAVAGIYLPGTRFRLLSSRSLIE